MSAIGEMGLSRGADAVSVGGKYVADKTPGGRPGVRRHY